MKKYLLLLLIPFLIQSGCINEPSIAKDGGLVVQLKIDDPGKMDETMAIIKKRIDSFHLLCEAIHKVNSTTIEVVLPGPQDQNRVAHMLVTTANLEFWETYENSEVYEYLQKAEGKVAASLMPDSTVGAVDTLSEVLSVDGEIKDSLEYVHQMEAEHPLFRYLMPAIYQGASGNYEFNKGPVVGYCHPSDTAMVTQLLNSEPAIKSFPANLKFCWTAEPWQTEPNQPLYMLIALKRSNRKGPCLNSDVIVKAESVINEYSGQPEISIAMNEAGAMMWQKMTGSNVGRSIAMVIDNAVYSYPTVNGEITGGVSVISGNFTVEETKNLAALLFTPTRRLNLPTTATP